MLAWVWAERVPRWDRAALAALSAAIAEAAKSSHMIENLAKVGNTTAFQTPGQFAATVRADLARWAPIVKASGFVADD